MEKQSALAGLLFSERKKIKQLLPALPLMKQVLQPVGRRHLCPRCTAVLSERTMRCRRCELPFKSKWVAGLMALLFPGGGYFYSRLFFPGAIFFALEALLVSLLVAVGASFIPVGADRSFLLGGLVLIWAGIKAAGWIHAGHFFKQYIPRKSRLDRWSPSMAGNKTRY
jgi:ribosomal protein L40E